MIRSSFISYLVFPLILLNHLVYSNEIDDSDFISTPEQIIALTEHPENLIEGVISPLGGLPCLQEIDLIAKGAQDVVSSRTYIPHHMPCRFHENASYDEFLLAQYITQKYQGWVTLPHKKINNVFLTHNYITITTPNAVTLKYLKISEDYYLASETKGMSNLSNDQVGAAYDLRNIKVFFSECRQNIIVSYPSGLTCHSK